MSSNGPIYTGTSYVMRPLQIFSIPDGMALIHTPRHTLQRFHCFRKVMLHGYMFRNAITPPKTLRKVVLHQYLLRNAITPQTCIRNPLYHYLHFCEVTAANLFLENPASGTFAAYNSNIICLYMHYIRLN
jgi:hypothetical protein